MQQKRCYLIIKLYPTSDTLPRCCSPKESPARFCVEKAMLQHREDSSYVQVKHVSKPTWSLRGWADFNPVTTFAERQRLKCKFHISSTFLSSDCCYENGPQKHVSCATIFSSNFSNATPPPTWACHYILVQFQKCKMKDGREHVHACASCLHICTWNICTSSVHTKYASDVGAYVYNRGRILFFSHIYVHMYMCSIFHTRCQNAVTQTYCFFHLPTKQLVASHYPSSDHYGWPNVNDVSFSSPRSSAEGEKCRALS